MGMDAKAYLWFGTKPREVPESWANLQDTEECSELIYGGPNDAPGWVSFGKIVLCAVSCRSFYHDWDYTSERLEINPPTAEEKAEVLRAAQALWPDVTEDEIGWYLGADFS